MVDYIIGILLILSTVLLLQLFGISLTKKTDHFSYSFVIGYIVYSFLVAIVGIPIQMFNLPWMTFFAWMVILLIGMIIYICWTFKTKKIQLSKKEIRNYFVENWFLYIGSILILMIALTHIGYLWSNNMTDDGYYLSKMATLPYIENPFRTDPVTGLYQSGINSYVLNTYELEASFYLFITKMNPALYARVFLSLFNYFLMLSSIHAFFEKIIDSFDYKLNLKYVQYLVPTLFFIFVMCASIFIESEAAWTIQSAAFYGSSIVRIACTFIALLPLIDINKLNFRTVLITLMTCVVMVSKSTVAVVLLFALAMSFLLDLCIRNKSKICCLLLVSFLVVVGIVLPNSEEINNAMIHTFLNLKNLSLIIPLIIMAVYSKKYPIYKRILFVSVFSLFLIICPSINDIVETASHYLFVTERTRYSLAIFIWIIGVSPIVFDILGKIRFFKQGCVIVFLSSMILVLITGYGDSNVLRAGKTYLNNPYIMPNSTILLGEKLEEYYEETGESLTIVMPSGVFLNGEGHFPSSIIRTYSPHTISIVGGIRISTTLENKDSKFDGFSLSDYDQISEFYIDPNPSTIRNVLNLNEKYPFDCFVGTNLSETHEKLLNSIGYEKYCDVEDYLITYNVFIKK